MQINWLSSEARKQQEICQRKVLLQIVRQSLRVFLEKVSAFSTNWSKKKKKLLNFLINEQQKPVYVRGDNNTFNPPGTSLWLSLNILWWILEKKLQHRKHST